MSGVVARAIRHIETRVQHVTACSHAYNPELLDIALLLPQHAWWI